MRVLHFTNIPFSADQIRSGGEDIITSGGWMVALLCQMLEKSNHSYACAAITKTDKFQNSSNDRIDCFTIPTGKFGYSISRKKALAQVS